MSGIVILGLVAICVLASALCALCAYVHKWARSKLSATKLKATELKATTRDSLWRRRSLTPLEMEMGNPDGLKPDTTIACKGSGPVAVPIVATTNVT